MSDDQVVALIAAILLTGSEVQAEVRDDEKWSGMSVGESIMRARDLLEEVRGDPKP